MQDKLFEIISSDETIHYNTLFDMKYEIGVRLQDKNVSFPKHYHNYIEIVCQINQSSIQCIDKQQVYLKKGDFLVINTKQYHSNESTTSDVLNLLISEKFLTSLLVESAFSEDIIKLKSSLSNVIHVEKYQCNDKLMHILNELHQNFINNCTLYYIKQKLLITDFLITLYESKQLAKENRVDETLNLTDYIKNNLKVASLNEYASLNNYSASLISQKIKKTYDMTFIEILHEVRLREAVRLLMTNMKIDDIIDEVGYQNKTHFYKLFKRKYNITPKQYKKEHVNNMNIN